MQRNAGDFGRRQLVCGVTAAILGSSARTARAAKPIRIGVLTDLSGPYAEISGIGSVTATRAAAEDFMKLSPGLAVDVLVGDMRTSPDLAVSITRQWFDTEGVDMVLGVPSSAAGLALTGLVRDKNKVAIFTEPGTSELTTTQCGPNHVHWTWDTGSATVPVVRQMLKEGKTSWFFIAPDYALGSAMVKDASAAIEAGGGKVVGLVRHPFPGTTDFSSYLLQAQASGAQVICLSSAGADVQNAVKQAGEFGISGKIALAAPLLELPDMHALGLAACQGLTTATAFYWDRNEASRAFTRRIAPLRHGEPPVQNHAGAYSAATHYLKAVTALGAAAASADGRRAVAQMKAIPLDDILFGKGSVREDGRTIHDVLVLRVKKPGEPMSSDYDMLNIVEITPGTKAFRPALQSCAFS